MPIDWSGKFAVPRRVTRSPLDVVAVPFHRSAGTPMAVPIIDCVPESASRLKINPSNVHGGTPDIAPKP